MFRFFIFYNFYFICIFNYSFVVCMCLRGIFVECYLYVEFGCGFYDFFMICEIDCFLDNERVKFYCFFRRG